MVSWFSKKTEKNKFGLEPIPPEILQSVRVMGDSVTTSASHETVATPLSANSPFLSGQPEVKSQEKTPVPAIPPQEELKVGEFQSPIPVKKLETKPKSTFATWFSVVVGLMLLLGAALYYWFFIFTAEEGDINENLTQDVEEVVDAPVLEVPPLPYALDAPNYLTLDVEVATLEDLQKILNDASTRILEAKITKPIEFILTDKNNNPLAFSRLAFLFNVNLPSELLATLGESFSFFLYNDNGTVYRGISVALAQREAALLEIQKNESLIPASFQELFYSTLAPVGTTVFRSGSYAGQVVRYVNIPETNNYSFDYIARERDWLIGTSKNTFRALFDLQ